MWVQIYEDKMIIANYFSFLHNNCLKHYPSLLFSLVSSVFRGLLFHQ